MSCPFIQSNIVASKKCPTSITLEFSPEIILPLLPALVYGGYATCFGRDNINAGSLCWWVRGIMEWNFRLVWIRGVHAAVVERCGQIHFYGIVNIPLTPRC